MALTARAKGSIEISAVPRHGERAANAALPALVLTPIIIAHQLETITAARRLIRLAEGRAPADPA
ncbi:hypothetical protein WG899_19900 [Paucibacter sp. AS339]|uniref:hypothetical protein n=1 Tax=Paucibacter hankyongi TaxID=3133434 RepID=UPI0030AF20B0